MHESALSAWESFYVIVGSSGGALIGLQFVVITLIADRRSLADATAVNAFGTPTVVHFTGALTVSAIMSAPWPSLHPLGVLLGATGITGLIYTAVVIRRARRQRHYQPVFEDWVWYAALPCCCYAALAVAAVVLPAGSRAALFGVAGTALALLLVGVHNAWDTVMHIAVSGNGAEHTPTERDS
jgi:hypothetical protein